MGRIQRKHTDGFKNYILQLLAFGATPTNLGRSYGLNPSVIHDWRKKALADGQWAEMEAAAKRTIRRPEPMHKTKPRVGVTVHPAVPESPYLGRAVQLCDVQPGIPVTKLPPGLGAVGGERDKEAAARLKVLEKGG